MQSEKITCAKKLEKILGGLVAEGVSITIHTQKESACSDPVIETVILEGQDGKFVIFKNTYGQNVQTNPTPKMVKKVRVSGTVGGVEVSKVFVRDDYEKEDFYNGLVNANREEFEEPEA